VRSVNKHTQNNMIVTYSNTNTHIYMYIEKPDMTE